MVKQHMHHQLQQPMDKQTQHIHNIQVQELQQHLHILRVSQLHRNILQPLPHPHILLPSRQQE